MATNVLPQGWILFAKGIEFLRKRFAFKDPRFVLENWDCKYIDARIDMRTGSMQLQPGNARTPQSFAPAQEEEVLEILREMVKLHDYSYLDKGIGIATPQGKRLLRAREIVRSAEPRSEQA